MAMRQTTRRTQRAAARRLAAPAVVALATFAAAAPEASCQVVAPGAVAPGGVYGDYGWGGWGSAATPLGRAAMGMGAFARGIGAGDLMSSQAGAIRAETWAELNEYLYRSRQIHLQDYAAREAARDQAQDRARQQLEDRVLNEPTPQDIESGGTLNRILFQLDNPAIPDSLVRDASQGMTIPGADVQKIPFMFTHKGAAVSLRRLTAEGEGWPTALRADALAPLRQRYEQTVERILQVPEGEPVPMELITEARSALGEMYRAIEAANLPGPVAAESMRYLRSNAGMVAMLKEPDVKDVLDQAGTVEQVDLPNLLNFMRVFNLQFGEAESPEEKALYSQQLYPMLSGARDRIAQQFDGKLPSLAGGPDQPTQTLAGSPAGAFEGYDWQQLGILGDPNNAGQAPQGNQPPTGQGLNPGQEPGQGLNPGQEPGQGQGQGQDPLRGAPRISDPGTN